MTVATITVLDALAAQQLVNCLPGLGQALMAGSLPVTIASNQGALTTNSTIVAAIPAGANVIGAVTQSGTWNITNISGTISLPTGASTSANQTTLNTNVGSSADPILTAGVAGSLASYMRTTMEIGLSTAPASVKVDQTTPGTTNAVAISHIGSTAVAAGAGVVGAGVIRTTQASDSPLVAGFGTAGTAKTYTGTFNVAATAMTRPANTTAYTALDSISNNATAGSVTANSVSLSDTNDHPIDISEIMLASTDTGPGGTVIRLHLFNSDPTASTGVVGGDNAAWSNKQAGWVGSFSGTMRAFSDGSRGVLIADEGTLRLINPATGAKTIYWQLQAITGFTPSANSTTFTPTFKGFQARPA